MSISLVLMLDVRLIISMYRCYHPLSQHVANETVARDIWGEGLWRALVDQAHVECINGGGLKLVSRTCRL